MQSLKRKREENLVSGRQYPEWLGRELRRVFEWMKMQYIRGRNATLDSYNATALSQLVPILSRCLRYVDIPFTLHYRSSNIVEFELG